MAKRKAKKKVVSKKKTPKKKPQPKPRITRKLTDKVKRAIKDAKGTQPLKNYDGAALAYLKKYKSLKKARKARNDDTLIVDGVKIQRNSKLYAIVKASAQMKGQTIKQYAAESQSEIGLLKKFGTTTIKRETDYLIAFITNLPPGAKVFVNTSPNFKKEISNHKEATKELAILYIKQVQITAAQYTDIFLIEYETQLNYVGDFYVTVPAPEDYEDILNDSDEGADVDEDFKDFLDNYYPEIQYMNSVLKGLGNYTTNNTNNAAVTNEKK